MERCQGRDPASSSHAIPFQGGQQGAGLTHRPLPAPPTVLAAHKAHSCPSWNDPPNIHASTLEMRTLRLQKERELGRGQPVGKGRAASG